MVLSNTVRTIAKVRLCERGTNEAVSGFFPLLNSEQSKDKAKMLPVSAKEKSNAQCPFSYSERNEESIYFGSLKDDSEQHYKGISMIISLRLRPSIV